jgi:HD-like signal output (HDOD) protein/DNA-binding NarL/FixJ family response regulator
MKFEFKRILIIDDDAQFCGALSRWLQVLGYQHSIAPTAAVGIELLGSSTFDALLLDLNLPDIHGHAIARQLNSSGNRVPVIVVSGTEEMGDVIRALRENVADFLRKPFTMDELEITLDRVLKRGVPARVASSPDLLQVHAPLPRTASRLMAAPVAAAPVVAAPVMAAPVPESRKGANPAPEAPPPESRAERAPASTPTPTAAVAEAAPSSNGVEAKIRPVALQLREQLKTGTIKLPVLDQKLIRLPEFLATQDWNVHEFAEVVARDSTLAAAVLRVANSASSARGQEVTSLSQACSRLGAKAVVAMSFEILVKAQFTATQEPYRAILQNSWKNSVIASRIAQMLGKQLGAHDLDGLRVAALFHNIGEQVYAYMLSNVDRQTSVTLEQVAVEMAALHEEFGGAITSSWKLPQLVVRLASRHHRMSRGDSKDHDRVRNLLLAAWAMALKAGLTYLPGQEQVDPAQYLSNVGLDEARVDAVFAAIDGWRAEL